MFPPVTVCAVQVMMFSGVGFKLRNFLLMTGTAKGRFHAGTIFQQCGRMRNMTLQTILILHIRTVRLMTLGTLEELSMDLMTRIAVKLGVSAGLTLHIFDWALMTRGTGRFYVLGPGQVNIHRGVRIVTLCTVRSSKVPVFFRIMTFLTLGDYPLLVWRMLLVTLNTLEIFKVGCPLLLEGGYYVIMTGSASVSSCLVCPHINSRFVRAVTGKTIGNCKILSVFLMAVRAFVVPALSQSVAVMTVVAVLLRVSAGELLHINARLRMTGYAAWFDIFEFCKISYYRCMRIMTSLAVFQGKVLFLCRVMAHAAFRNYYLSCRRMPLMTVKTPYNIPVS